MRYNNKKDSYKVTYPTLLTAFLHKNVFCVAIRLLSINACWIKTFSCVVSTYLYDVFDCMFLSSSVRVSEWVHTLQSQGTPCLKQALYLKIKWLQRDSSSQSLSSLTNTQLFSQTGQLLSCIVSTYMYGAFDCMLLSSTIEYGFTLKHGRDMIRTYSQMQIRTHNTCQSVGKFG